MITKPTTQPTPFQQKDLIAALCVVFIWGTNFVAMKVGLKDFTPFQLGAARYTLAVLPLILFVRPPRLHWKWVVLFGLFQGVGQFGLLFVALRVGMTAALASVLLQTQVFFTALFGVLLLRERIGRSLQIGLMLAGLGITCFVLNYLLPGASSAGPATTTYSAAGALPAPAASSLLGFMLCLAAASMWAASNIVVRRAQRSTPGFEVLPFLVWSCAVPIVPFILLTLAFDPPATRWRWVEAPWSGWVSIAYLGWIATIVGYAMWTGLLKRHAVNRVAPFSLGVPIVGLAAGILVLHEVVTPWQWAGITLLVAALVTVFIQPAAVATLWKKIARS